MSSKESPFAFAIFASRSEVKCLAGRWDRREQKLLRQKDSLCLQRDSFFLRLTSKVVFYSVSPIMSKEIESILHEKRHFPPPADFQKKACLKSFAEYKKMWEESVKNPEEFWGKIADDFVWFKKWTKVLEYDFKDRISIKWFDGAQTNITVNCLDRHIQAGLGERIAAIWEGNEPGENRKITYRELRTDVCRFANALKNQGVKKGDRVTIYMPMVPELAVAMLACARIGAVHSVVFGGFSAEALADRLIDAKSHLLITADGAFRGNKKVALKQIADSAVNICQTHDHQVKNVIVLKRTGESIAWSPGRDLWWSDLVQKEPDDCAPEPMEAEDPLFILYTSGSTGKPKGVLHTTAGYMVFTAVTFKYIFDYKPEDIYWCTADIGWITGHSYIVYAPLINAATTVLFEGIPTYPAPDRFWDVCERHKVSIFYTAPTAIRALMREGETWVKKHDLSSIRLLGSVGEPINPEAWIWYHSKVGEGRCPVVDTWWQTETGGILISPLPGISTLKPGCASVPFFGVDPVILKEDGTPCDAHEGGYLCIRQPWPGIMRTVYGHHEKFRDAYFSRFPGFYTTGDGCRLDEDGDYWLMGRLDDVIKVSGHRIGAAEVESALVGHPSVAEAAVVGYPHPVKGEAIHAFVTLKADQTPSKLLNQALVQQIRETIGPIAVPDKIQFAPALPKTRSGKIMRRILRKIAAGDLENLGDTTTLADPAVVSALVEGQSFDSPPVRTRSG